MRESSKAAGARPGVGIGSQFDDARRNRVRARRGGYAAILSQDSVSVNTPAIIRNMGESWNGRPLQLSVGTARTGVAAALWSQPATGFVEVTANADAFHHLIILALKPAHSEVWLDGRRTFKKAIATWDCNIAPAGTHARAINRGPVTVLHMALPTRLLDNMASLAVSRQTTLELIDPACKKDAVIENIGRQMLSAMSADAPLSRLRIDILGQELAIRILSSHSNLAEVLTRAALPSAPARSDWRIRRAIDHLEAALGSDIGLAELAAVADLSPRHFSDLFRAATGSPPHQWLMRRRVERAREMLDNPKLKVTAIAHACGFSSSQHLATVFKRQIGATPMEYRRERLR